MTGLGILENLVSDILFILIILAVGWLWVRATRRRRLHQFFGASHTKRIVVYLSNIRVLTFGSAGVSGTKMSYQGSTVAHGEMLAANRIRELFSFVLPAASEGPSFLNKVLFSDILVQVLLSPLQRSELDSDATIISLGSAAYNSASGLIEETIPSGAKFRFGTLKRRDVDASPPYFVHPLAGSTDTEVHIWPSGTANPQISSSPSLPPTVPDAPEKPSAILIQGVPDITGTQYAFIQRALEPSSHRTLFYVAGLSEPATAAAASFLAVHWDSLARRHPKNSSFLTMLVFEEPDFRKWSIAFERLLTDAA